MPTLTATRTRLAALVARLPMGAPLAAGWGSIRLGYWTRLVPVLAVVATLTHIPSFMRPVWSPDEGYLATQARMLASGGVFYDTVVDRKPPLLPWLYEACFSVFGSLSLWPLRTLAIVAHVVTAVLLVSIARGRWGNRAGAAAGVLYLLLSIGLSPEDTQAATFEVFMLPAMVAAFRYAERRRWLAAGIAVAVSSLTKQTGGAVLLPVLWMLFQDARLRGVRWRSALLKVSFGFALPIAVVAVILTKPKGFLFWVVTGSGDYASLGGNWLQMIGRALGNSAILLAAGLGFLFPLGHRLWTRLRTGRSLPTRGEAHGAPSDLWVWTVSSVIAVAVGFHFYGHYYLQLMPPLVLLGVGAVSVSAVRWKPVLIYSTAAASAFWVLAMAWPGQQMSQTTQVATAVAERSTAKDTVLVWGMHPELYWLSDRKPATRYLTAGFLTNFSGGKGTQDVGEQYSMPDAWQTFDQELATNGLPEIVVDDSGRAPYQPLLVPKIENLLDDHYEVVGAYGDTVVYRLKK
ncbi:ArnT family glycosyltransferase [Kitasatospora kifunensis]|uniref:4-amino-4-deoxy-L-arabinose transferase-like glycosyltransferase n=1 Tax=Kitasatospora kifunensis TaxID=58351 RepID=A0A7W7R5H3_KITKI|nr:glycosyltransferase family 39 protein [Kitasatospora kifunensis]MBB4925792.1 4-amino-4-deoxy-L-arabinose transferase-like glycosyltransferase [Kitasatospora kifunensis]